jgi:hypothetical protein
MPVTGYTVNGSREIIDVGIEALEALRGLIERNESLGAEVAEIRLYENMPIEAVLGFDWGFQTWVWTRHAWVAK